MNDCELHWLAGILEGEGSFMKGPPSSPHSPKICVEMTDEDVVARVAELMCGVKPVKVASRNTQWKQSWRATLKGRRAVKLMNSIRPLMGKRRQAQIDTAIACFKDGRAESRKLSAEQVKEMRQRYADGENVKALAEEMGVFFTAAYRIINGQNYADV